MGPGRVLVVDGVTNARRAICELLEGEGYEVLATDDGAPAAEAARRFRPDVALLDASQPERQPRLGALAALSPVAILMSSGDPPRSLHGLPFLRKPIDVVELFAAVATAVAKARHSGRSD